MNQHDFGERGPMAMWPPPPHQSIPVQYLEAGPELPRSGCVALRVRVHTHTRTLCATCHTHTERGDDPAILQGLGSTLRRSYASCAHRKLCNLDPLLLCLPPNEVKNGPSILSRLSTTLTHTLLLSSSPLLVSHSRLSFQAPRSRKGSLLPPPASEAPPSPCYFTTASASSSPNDTMPTTITLDDFWSSIDDSWTSVRGGRRAVAGLSNKSSTLRRLAVTATNVLRPEMLKALERRLRTYSAEQLRAWDAHLGAVLAQLDRPDVEAALRPASDESFVYARAWVIGSGREYFARVDGTPGAYGVHGQWAEDVLEVAIKVYERRYGKWE